MWLDFASVKVLCLNLGFLDCSKGFIMLSWEWLTAVLRHAGLPEQLVHGISSLMHRHTSYMCFRGNVYSPVTLLVGYSQSAGVAHVWGFCDDGILDRTLQS